MRIRLRVLAITLIAIGIQTSVANAAIITYNNLASWQGAVVGVNTTTFEQNATEAPLPMAPDRSLSVAARTRLSGGGNIFTVDPDFISGALWLLRNRHR